MLLAVKMPSTKRQKVMSANAIGKYLPFTASPKVHNGTATHERERRATVRTSLHWPVVFRHRQTQTLESVTENLSSQGFYCLSQFPVPSGESLLCWLTVPTHDPSGAKESIVEYTHGLAVNFAKKGADDPKRGKVPGAAFAPVKR